MPDIQIHRAHRLGLPEARRLARQWAEQAQTEFGVTCTVVEGKPGEPGERIEFTRPGADGALLIEADRVTVVVRLGLLAGMFAGAIQAEIENKLDALLLAHRPAGNAAPAGAEPSPARSGRRAKKK